MAASGTSLVTAVDTLGWTTDWRGSLACREGSPRRLPDGEGAPWSDELLPGSWFVRSLWSGLGLSMWL